MALDLNALATDAFKTAKQLAPQAFRKATVRLGPTNGSYDPVTDTTTTTWDLEFTDLDVLKYEDETKREDQPLEDKMVIFLADIADLPGSDDQTLQQDGILIEQASSTKWECYRTEVDPSKSIVQFYCRR